MTDTTNQLGVEETSTATSSIDTSIQKLDINDQQQEIDLNDNINTSSSIDGQQQQNVEHEQQQQQQQQQQSSNTVPMPTTASTVVTNEISSITNQNDIHNILNTQTEILAKQYETNTALQHFNDYSAQKYAQVSHDFEKHTKMLKEMKRDLEYIFKKTRTLQSLLNDKFPNINVAQTTHLVEDD
ncbi:hypothetical protein SAMD00019534_097840 [Acytostelium subglobosum LB1]|uniref:hypothetical protein n=1 Tax=Acytostelium subglobosum LB1 TaxID=1410327 RepID=UPI0006451226|nr:hypothetical protein SAMD00019534_097840 [Acytostelium subglobosum LB1]GAM26609.1 hypothetical protein SAMD00019534_097840 [Acytostelium subglobosum LB1]|eukprot:XP_012750270.1 hypothetical protein SAMD00019534_097840 [Acytostelium subglobosum LB1]